MPDTCPEGHSLRNGPRVLSRCYVCQLAAAGINPRMHGGASLIDPQPTPIAEFDRQAKARYRDRTPIDLTGHGNEPENCE